MLATPQFLEANSTYSPNMVQSLGDPLFSWTPLLIQFILFILPVACLLCDRAKCRVGRLRALTENILVFPVIIQ